MVFVGCFSLYNFQFLIGEYNKEIISSLGIDVE